MIGIRITGFTPQPSEFEAAAFDPAAVYLQTGQDLTLGTRAFARDADTLLAWIEWAHGPYARTLALAALTRAGYVRPEPVAPRPFIRP